MREENLVYLLTSWRTTITLHGNTKHQSFKRVFFKISQDRNHILTVWKRDLAIQALRHSFLSCSLAECLNFRIIICCEYSTTVPLITFLFILNLSLSEALHIVVLTFFLVHELIFFYKSNSLKYKCISGRLLHFVDLFGNP